MSLDVSNFDKVLQQLKKSYAYGQSELAQKDPDLFVQFRFASIQGFQYSYESSIKMLRRQLEAMEFSAEAIEHLSYKDMIRTAAEKGLIDDVPAWFDFKKMRNLTVHTYDESKAQTTFQALPQFIKSATNLLRKLKEKT